MTGGWIVITGININTVVNHNIDKIVIDYNLEEIPKLANAKLKILI